MSPNACENVGPAPPFLCPNAWAEATKVLVRTGFLLSSCAEEGSDDWEDDIPPFTSPNELSPSPGSSVSSSSTSARGVRDSGLEPGDVLGGDMGSLPLTSGW